MPDLFVVGLLVAVPITVLGVVLIGYGARRQWEREAPYRRREEIVELMMHAVDKALDPEPRVSLDGLRLLSMLRDSDLVEPEDEDFIENIASVIVATRLEKADAGASLVLGTAGGVPGVPPEQVVLPHELLAALLAMDVAASRGREPSPLAWRVANASSANPGNLAAPEAEPLKRTA